MKRLRAIWLMGRPLLVFGGLAVVVGWNPETAKASDDITVTGDFSYDPVSNTYSVTGAQFAMTPPPRKGPARVVVVSDSHAPNDPEGMDFSDNTLVVFLESFNHIVDTSGMSGALREDSDPFNRPDAIEAMGSADLILVSRHTLGEHYDDDRQNWNELQKPILLMNGDLTPGGAENRWGWTTAGSQAAARTQHQMIIEPDQQEHPLLDGLTGPIDLFDWLDAPDHQAPKEVYLPEADTLRAGTTLVGSFDGLSYLFEISAGTDLGGDFGTTGEQRVFMGHWGYDFSAHSFDHFVTDGFLTLVANVVEQFAPVAGPGTLDIPETNLAVATSSSLHFETDQLAILGNLRLEPGAIVDVSGPPAVSFQVVTAGEGSSVASDLHVRGTLLDGNAPGTLTVRGELQLEPSATFAVTVGEWGSDSVICESDVYLDGTLTLQAAGMLPPEGQDWGNRHETIRIAEARGEGIIFGNFDDVPVEGQPLGHGVFLTGLDLNYGSTTVDLDLDLFQAAAGDTDGDHDVDGDDIQNILAANTFPRLGPADWGAGDFNGDELCDGDDIQAILATGLFGQGPYPVALPALMDGPDARAAVPEPGPIAMLAGCLIVLLSRRCWVRLRTGVFPKQFSVICPGPKAIERIRPNRRSAAD